MKPIIHRIANQCVESGIVEADDVEWFIYGLEKRFVTAATALLLLFIGGFLSDSKTAFAYLGSFYFLRVRTNGYHAATVKGCICVSVILEIGFLLIIRSMLFPFLSCILNLINCFLVFSFAPFNHPSMHMDEQELAECRKRSRIRISLLTLLSVVGYVFSLNWLGDGITLGNTMAALLLIIVKIKKGETNNEERKEKTD